MDHIRTVKPSFFTDEQMGARPPLERLLFVSLWCQADREGRLEDRPGRIKVKALPYDECDVDAMLTNLQLAGFVLRYEHEERRYIQVLAFGKHQRPNSREPQSEIPAPQPFVIRTRMHAHAHGEGKGTEGNGKGREGVSSAGADVQAVFDHWRSVLGHPDGKLTPKRVSAVRGRLRDGYSLEQLKLAIDGCKASAFHMGDNGHRKVYDDLSLICRDGEHVEQFLGYSTGSAIVLARPAQKNLSPKAEVRRDSIKASFEASLKGDGTVPSGGDGD